MDIVVGLGANLGDAVATLRLAALRIARIAPVLARSGLWASAPVGGPPQPDFVNAAVLVGWSAEPIELLDVLLRIEQELGRVREVVNGPRTIDLDMLWIRGQAIATERLIVPHPRLHERAFAIAPLLEVAPAAVDPRTGRVYTVPDGQRIRPLGERL